MSKLLVLRWFCKAKATRSVITYSSLSRKFKIIDSELAPLKQKYKDFALTWFWEFTVLDVQLIGFMMKYLEILCIIHHNTKKSI